MKLLEVNPGIVAEAWQRTLAGGELGREAIAGMDLVLLPRLQNAGEVIAGRRR